MIYCMDFPFILKHQHLIRQYLSMARQFDYIQRHFYLCSLRGRIFGDVENFATGTGFGVADARLDEVAGIFSVYVWEGGKGADECPSCVGAGGRPEEIHGGGVVVKLGIWLSCQSPLPRLALAVGVVSPSASSPPLHQPQLQLQHHTADYRKWSEFNLKARVSM